MRISDWSSDVCSADLKVVQVGDELEVMVLDVDEERRRISLGIKQVTSNPWETFAAIHKKGDKVEGQIKSITEDRKSDVSGKSVSVRVALGGRRIIKKKTNNITTIQ